MDNTLDHQIETAENTAKFFFLEGFRYKINNGAVEMSDAVNFIDGVMAHARRIRERNLMSAVPESK